MAKFSAQGTKLQVSIASVFTDVPQVTGQDFPSIARLFEDVTALDSPGNFKEYAAIMNDVEEITAEMIWDPTNAVQDYLMDQAALAVGVLDAFKIIASDTGTANFAFNAFVASFKPTANQNSVLRATLTLRVSGGFTYTQ